MPNIDSQLLKEAQRNHLAFAEIYKKYYQKIYNYFWYRVGHDEDVAEDLTQDTFVQAFKALPRYKDTGTSYFSYLLTIAHNLLVNYYRTPKPISIETTGVEVPDEIWSSIDTKDNIRSLWRAIQQLSETEKNILYLKYQKGYKVAEIAKITGKTDNAVKLILSRTRRKLQAHPYLKSISGFSEQKRSHRSGRYEKHLKSKPLKK
jgi:RNA polymerase sigma-70 factor (ECF subfamily)